MSFLNKIQIINHKKDQLNRNTHTQKIKYQAESKQYTH